MNPIQKQWLGLGVAVMLIMVICPPWTRITHQVLMGPGWNLVQTEAQDFAGYSLLFDPPPTHQLVQGQRVALPGDFHQSVRFDFDRLLLQWLTVAFLTGAGLLYFKDSDKRSLREWWSTIQHSPKPSPPPDPPVSRSSVPLATGGGEANQRMPPSGVSPWKRAQKSAGTAFDIGIIAGVASAYKASLRTGFPFGGRILFTLLCGLFCALLLAAITYLVAGLFYEVKGGAEGEVKPDSSGPGNKGRSLVWAGILVVVAVLCVIGESQQGSQPREIQDTTGISAAGTPSTSGQWDQASQPVATLARDSARFATEAQTATEALANGAGEAIARRQGATPTRADSPNAVTLGWRYENGSGGVDQDYAKAAYWYRLAAEGGDVVAQNNLGTLYQTGRGVPRDLVEAYVWYSLSAAQGSLEARNNLNTLVGALTAEQINEGSGRILATEEKTRRTTTSGNDRD